MVSQIHSDVLYWLSFYIVKPISFPKYNVIFLPFEISLIYSKPDGTRYQSRMLRFKNLVYKSWKVWLIIYLYCNIFSLFINIFCNTYNFNYISKLSLLYLANNIIPEYNMFCYNFTAVIPFVIRTCYNQNSRHIMIQFIYRRE